jgi:hypothetical protein
MNLFAFTFNCPVSVIDTDGRFPWGWLAVGAGVGAGLGTVAYNWYWNDYPKWDIKPFPKPSASSLSILDHNENLVYRDGRTRFVKVASCEMVFVFGHGGNRGSWVFEFPDRGLPAAAGFLGCKSDVSNRQIQNHRQPRLIPGSPIAHRDPNSEEVDPEDLWKVDTISWRTNARQIQETLSAVEAGMAKLVNEWLTTACCKSVVVSYVNQDRYSYTSPPKSINSISISKPVTAINVHRDGSLTASY